MSLSAIVLDVPDLADDLVRLRAWQRDDAPALVMAWSDPAILLGARPPDDRSERGARRWIDGCEIRRKGGVALDLVIADPRDDIVLGEIGLSRFDRQRRAAMAGWWVAEASRGQGVATRAVTMLTEWVLDASLLSVVVAEIAVENLASQRVAIGAGFGVLRPGSPGTTAVFVRAREASSNARATFGSRP